MHARIWGLATGNPHKVREITGILRRWCAVQVVPWEKSAHLPLNNDPYRAGSASASDLILILPPPTLKMHEPYATYYENSHAKALTFYQWLYKHSSHPLPVLAEDSGLEVDTLHGLPGPYSAVWGHPKWTAHQRIQFLLECLKGQNRRTARFRAVLTALFTPTEYLFFEGILPGNLCEAPRGSQGFGYDPIFIPSGNQQTLAELPEETKNRISHRAQALRSWIEWMGWIK